MKYTLQDRISNELLSMRRASISVNQNNGYWDNKNKLFQTQQDNQEQQQIKRNSTNFQIFKQSPNKML